MLSWSGEDEECSAVEECVIAYVVPVKSQYKNEENDLKFLHSIAFIFSHKKMKACDVHWKK